MARKEIAKKGKADPIKRFMAMPDEDAETVYKSVDREFKLSETRPLTRAQRRAFEKSRKPGRPKIGAGAQLVPITVERGLLQRVNDFAKQHGYKRSELFVAGVNVLMRNPKLLKRKGAA